jgi:hypothetical protein
MLETCILIVQSLLTSGPLDFDLQPYDCQELFIQPGLLLLHFVLLCYSYTYVSFLYMYHACQHGLFYYHGAGQVSSSFVLGHLSLSRAYHFTSHIIYSFHLCWYHLSHTISLLFFPVLLFLRNHSHNLKPVSLFKLPQWHLSSGYLKDYSINPWPQLCTIRPWDLLPWHNLLFNNKLEKTIWTSCRAICHGLKFALFKPLTPHSCHTFFP